ncbi:MAG: 3'-5' exonuclease [Dehalococcoidia bacterium]|nr:UvrD-helicase domain-containing protein [Dehalococcoidia bacterium]MCB9486985.1 UvrD-helicase domain-containing protein [Thermoflexaceae bacterium]
MSSAAGTAETLLEGLNEPQLRAVTLSGGPLLIVAGPGSGKTRVITHRLAYLVREERVAPWRILAVTFTNKAAREMRERAANLLGEDAGSLALGTFHSLCARWLRIDGEAIGIDKDFVIYDDADQVGAMKRVLEDLHIDAKRYSPRAILSAISSAKNELVSVEAYRQRVKSYPEEIVARAWLAYEATLRRSSALDFDDLLVHVVHMFAQAPEVLEKYAGRFKHVLVDEFQDTNSVQYHVAHALAAGFVRSDTGRIALDRQGPGHRNIAVVGDPDQSIYSWRAADIRNFSNFADDFPEHQVVLLEQNYRSSPHILEAADAVIQKNPQRTPRKLWTARESGTPIGIHEAYNDEEEAEFIATEIARLAKGGRAYGQVAILYRTNAQSRPIEDALVRHRIPYRIIGGLRFYQRKEVKDLIAYLRLLQNPRDEASLLRVVNTPSRGVGAKTIERLSAWARESNLTLWDACEGAALGRIDAGLTTRIASGLREFVTAILSLQASVADIALERLLDHVLEASGYRSYLAGDPEAEERLGNIEQLRAVMEQRSGVEGGAADLAAFLQDVSLIADVDEMEGGPNAATLITLHAAKGLEFPVVFIAGMEEGVLPHIRSFDDPRQMEEERRLAYVGITRAGDELYLTRAFRRFAMGGGSTNPASRFLSDIPPSLTRPSNLRGARGLAPSTGNRYADLVVATPPVDEPPPAEAEFEAGARVRHAKFGDGTVISAQKNGGDVEYQVTFDGAGVKRLLQTYARLAPV